jgi:4a-hydroxytetrahydrobiopterin dehydratase
MTQAPANWKTSKDGKWLECEIESGSYWETISQVNAVAMVAQKQNHHPDMAVGYKKLNIRYTTHSEGGLTQKDYAAAARINQVLELG